MSVTKKYREEDYSNKSKNEINAIAKCLNMSDEGIRIYEKKGLVYPDVNEDSRKRSYDVMDFTMLLYSRVYKKYGFTLKEVEHIVNDCSIHEIQDLMRRQIQKKQDEISQLQLAISCMQDAVDGIDRHNALLGRCEIAPFPGLYRLEFMHQNNYLGDHDPQLVSLIARWSNYSPASMISSRYPLEEILQSKTPKSCFAGMGMLPKYAELLSLEENEYVSFCPPCERAIHVILSADNTQLTADMQRIADFIRENDLKPDKDAVTLGIVNNNFNTTFTRYFHLWIPLEEPS